MKKSFSLLAALWLFAAPIFAQDVTIPLQPFTLQIPEVNALVVRPIAAPVLDVNPADTTKQMLFQPIYYELRRADGREVERGNKSIPYDLYIFINKYITRTVTPTDVAIINQFFQYADWPLTAIMPE